ncbi:MAG TPA: hypothetical protein VHO70_16375 [Chitinispirillaceae bacterium]|nr:hypothetical protein [Chitinispirillaceae bacterium]
MKALESGLLISYILFCCSLNFFAFLISAFYKKSLQKSSPKAGFIVAIVLALLFVVIDLYGINQNTPLQILSVIFLLGSGVASIISIIALFTTMSKIQK